MRLIKPRGGLSLVPLLLSGLAAFVLSASGSAQKVPKRRIACKTRGNAATCYWTHGRLSAYNGTPSYRLWKIGTHRLLGIYSGPDAEKRNPLDSEDPEFPANVKRAFKSASTQIFGDFEVCPLEPERPGWMQSACIESAKNLVVVEPDKRR